MTFSVQETLFSLLRLNGISGHESSIANVMQHAFEQQAKDVWRDRLGNVVARYGSDKSDALRLMIFAHMDEVGFMVRKIEPSGFLRFERVGGPAQITMPGSVVTLAGRSGDIMGLSVLKHITSRRVTSAPSHPRSINSGLISAQKIKRMPNEWVFRWGRQ